jgi:hypothetical protein
MSDTRASAPTTPQAMRPTPREREREMFRLRRREGAAARHDGETAC